MFFYSLVRLRLGFIIRCWHCGHIHEYMLMLVGFFLCVCVCVQTKTFGLKLCLLKRVEWESYRTLMRWLLFSIAHSYFIRAAINARLIVLISSQTHCL